MPRAIKISDETYNELLRLQQPRETFNDVVWKLVQVFRVTRQLTEDIKTATANERKKLDEVR